MAEMRQVAVRFPLDVKSWLEEQARQNGSSQNSEVIRAIRAAMEGRRSQPAPASDNGLSKAP